MTLSYDGPEALREPIANALIRVVDPEVALSIVDVGLVYGVTVDDDRWHVRLTMTTDRMSERARRFMRW